MTPHASRARRITAGALVAVAVTLTACGNTDTEDTAAEPDQTTTSPELTWEDGPAGLQTPQSDAGPHKTKPVPHGWDPTPHGAVSAAIAGHVWMAGADDATWPEVATTMLEPGPGRDQWAQARSLVSVNGTVEERTEFTGFKIADYTDNAATIVLATKWPNGDTLAYPVQVSHSTGDWRVVVPEQGSEPDYKQISSTDEFIPLTTKEA